VKDMLYEVAKWRIYKEFSKNHLEMWQQVLDEQKAYPEKYQYIKSRILQLAEKEAEPSEETWMYIDEYEGREAYDKAMKAIAKDPMVKKHKKKWLALWDPMKIPGSFKAELWTERVKVELKKKK
jgi:hypothetical protein